MCCEQGELLSLIPSREGSVRGRIFFFFFPQLHPSLSLSHNLPSRYWVRRTDDELKLRCFGELSYLKGLIELIITSCLAQECHGLPADMVPCHGMEGGVTFAAVIIHNSLVKTLPSHPRDAASNAHRSLCDAAWFLPAQAGLSLGLLASLHPCPRTAMQPLLSSSSSQEQVYVPSSNGSAPLPTLHSQPRSCNLPPSTGTIARATRPCYRSAITAPQCCDSF